MSITITITDPTRDEALRVAEFLYEFAGYGKTAGVVSHRFEPNAARQSEILKQHIEDLAAGGANSSAPPEVTTRTDGSRLLLFAGTGVSAIGEYAGRMYCIPPDGLRWVLPNADEVGMLESEFWRLQAEVEDTGPLVPATASERPSAVPPAGHLDSAGYPWDERIHSSSQALNQDGTWRLKRGVDLVLVTQVREELKRVPLACNAAPTITHDASQLVLDGADEPGATDTFDVVVPPAPPAPIVMVVGGDNTAAIEQIRDFITSPVPPAPDVTVPSAIAFPQLMQRVTAMCAAKTMTIERVLDAAKAEGVDSIPLLATTHADKVGAVAARLGVTV